MLSALRWRWLPLASALAATAAILLFAGTPAVDLLRYVAYAVGAVVLPGTLVFRALRRSAHTFVEDVAFGAAVGLALELGAWALFSALDLRGIVWLWPALVFLPFALVPALRRHWRPRDYAAAVPAAWAWSLAAVVVLFTLYLYGAFFAENPIVPDSEATKQFVDLPYQLSLAGEAKHHFPLNLPQVAGERLHYHWFAFVHMAMTSMVGHIDLPVVTTRLMIPALCALSATLTAVVGWRLSGRRWVGVVAAALFFVVGEFDFSNASWPPFATQVTFIVWPSLSVTYGWAVLVAMIGIGGEILRTPGGESRAPRMGAGAYAVLALLAVLASASKATLLPVTVGALGVAGLAMLVSSRRIPWNVVAAGAVLGGAQLFAMGAIFAFETYGLQIVPLSGLKWVWRGTSGGRQAVFFVAAWVAYLINLQLRGAGVLAVLWHRRGRLEPVQWFLLGGAVVGPAFYLMVGGFMGTFFTEAGLPFGLLLSAWGYVLVVERAALSRRGRIALGAFAAVFAAVVLALALLFAVDVRPAGRGALLPILVPAAIGVVLAVAGWFLLPRRVRGVVVLTAVLLAGIPALALDARRSLDAPNGGAWGGVGVPASQAEAARWVRDHSAPDDVLATNSHCVRASDDAPCDNSLSFWLSAYAERSVLVEGWAFAPRIQAAKDKSFWDPELLRLNDDSVSAPTPELLRRLRVEYRVRFLVVDRREGAESPDLARLADLRHANGRVAVYELR